MGVFLVNSKLRSRNRLHILIFTSHCMFTCFTTKYSATDKTETQAESCHSDVVFVSETDTVVLYLTLTIKT